MIQIINEKNMTAEQFCYWLQGMLEIQDPKSLNEKQLKIIKDHLQLVFHKVTPYYYQDSITTIPCTYPICTCNSTVCTCGNKNINPIVTC